MLKGPKPDPLNFAQWAASSLDFREGYSWKARALWLHWLDHCQRERIEPGTPRSFSSALRKIGSPSERPIEGNARRTRYHRDVRLVLAKISADDMPRDWDESTRRSAANWANGYAWRRYVYGEETRQHQREKVDRAYRASVAERANDA